MRISAVGAGVGDELSELAHPKLYVWPEVVVGLLASTVLVALWLVRLEPTSIEDLGIPVQVIAAVTYGIVVGGLSGLAVGITLLAASAIAQRLKFGVGIARLLRLIGLAAICSFLAWFVPTFHATEVGQTLPYFAVGGVVVALVDLMRDLRG